MTAAQLDRELRQFYGDDLVLVGPTGLLHLVELIDRDGRGEATRSEQFQIALLTRMIERGDVAGGRRLA